MTIQCWYLKMRREGGIFWPLILVIYSVQQLKKCVLGISGDNHKLSLYLKRQSLVFLKATSFGNIFAHSFRGGSSLSWWTEDRKSTVAVLARKSGGLFLANLHTSLKAFRAPCFEWRCSAQKIEPASQRSRCHGSLTDFRQSSPHALWRKVIRGVCHFFLSSFQKVLRGKVRFLDNRRPSGCRISGKALSSFLRLSEASPAFHPISWSPKQAVGSVRSSALCQLV